MEQNLLLITEAELQAELAAIEVEAMGWLPLTTEEGESAYLHLGDPNAMVVTVVGVPDAAMAVVNVLWVGLG